MADLAAITLFAIGGTITPGPNNLMVTASGSAFGFRRSLPHMLGITLGFPAMLVAVGLGLAEVFERYPILHHGLKYVGAAYLLYLAWRIARAGAPDAPDDTRRPLSFVEAAAFQWVNPKAWTLALGAIPAFTTIGGDYVTEVLIIAAVFALICFPCIAVWCGFGLAIRDLIRSDRARRAVNLTLAGLVAGSVILLFV